MIWMQMQSAGQGARMRLDMKISIADNDSGFWVLSCINATPPLYRCALLRGTLVLFRVQEDLKVLD